MKDAFMIHLGQTFDLFSRISFTIEWKFGQGSIRYEQNMTIFQFFPTNQLHFVEHASRGRREIMLSNAK